VLSGDEKWMPVCGLNRLIAQTIVCARVTGVDVILIWNEGRAVACERMCPHEQADLSAGRLSGGRLCCRVTRLRSISATAGFPMAGQAGRCGYTRSG
jgi:nitrite reductase/ring-hydroxylating ferredoxin subunit